MSAFDKDTTLGELFDHMENMNAACATMTFGDDAEAPPEDKQGMVAIFRGVPETHEAYEAIRELQDEWHEDQ